MAVRCFEASKDDQCKIANISNRLTTIWKGFFLGPVPVTRDLCPMGGTPAPFSTCPRCGFYLFKGECFTHCECEDEAHERNRGCLVSRAALPFNAPGRKVE